MKLSKKLLPLALAGTTIALPVITSCAPTSYVFEAVGLEYKPTYQHDTSTDLTQEQVAREYFSNSTYVLADMAYARIKSVNSDYQSKKEDSMYSNVHYSVETKTSKITLGDVEKRTLLDEEGAEFEAWGVTFSQELIYSVSRSYTITYPAEYLPTGLTALTISTIDNETYNISLTNNFAYLWYENVGSSPYWACGIYVDKARNWQQYEEVYTYSKDTYTATYKGETKVDVNETNKEEVRSDSLSNEGDDYYETLSRVGVDKSYYLAQVTPKD